MDELLSQVLEAHGGLDRWDQVTQITAHLSAGGPFWAGRGWPDILADTTVTLDAHREQITFAPFGVPERQSSFSVDPERIVISNTSGDILDERCDPRGSFPSEFDPRSTLWDAVQVAYFTSYAMWNYLTAPFVFTYPDVEAKEIDPWQEAGETWRRLAVTFPPSIANHNPDQIFYYDEKYMQRRMDYSPQVTGRLPIAHYTHDPKTFDGFVFPTRRLVHRHDQHGIADQSLAVITLDLDDITVAGP
jgi:hypothetical protein